MVHSSIDITAQSMSLNSLEHCIYIHNLDDKHPTRPEFEPSTAEFRATTVQLDLMSHRGLSMPYKGKQQ